MTEPAPWRGRKIVRKNGWLPIEFLYAICAMAKDERLPRPHRMAYDLYCAARIPPKKKDKKSATNT